MSIAPEQFIAYLTAERFFTAPGNIPAHSSVRTIGELHLPSGALVACDPALIEPIPLVERLPRGRFPVAIVIVSFLPAAGPFQRLVQRFIPPPPEDRRIALAAITLREEPPAYWRPAEQQAPGQAAPAPYIYAVDSATGSYMDLQTAERARAGGDLFAQVSVERENPEDEPAWMNMTLRDAPQLNIVAFSSGDGDGAYPVYIGYTATHQAARVVTDFKVL